VKESKKDFNLVIMVPEQFVSGDAGQGGTKKRNGLAFLHGERTGAKTNVRTGKKGGKKEGGPEESPIRDIQIHARPCITCKEGSEERGKRMGDALQ